MRCAAQTCFENRFTTVRACPALGSERESVTDCLNFLQLLVRVTQLGMITHRTAGVQCMFCFSDAVVLKLHCV